MAAAGHVGRVGSLAVFLGIGAAVGLAQAGPAIADNGSTSNEAGSIASGRNHPEAGRQVSTMARARSRTTLATETASRRAESGVRAGRQNIPNPVGGVVPMNLSAKPPSGTSAAQSVRAPTTNGRISESVAVEVDAPHTSAPVPGLPTAIPAAAPFRAAPRRGFIEDPPAAAVSTSVSAEVLESGKIVASPAGLVVSRGQLSFAVHQAVQAAQTLAQAMLNSVAAMVGRLFGIAKPSVPALTGVGNPIIPTTVGPKGRVTGSSDPQLTYYEGQYYATYSSWDHIEIRTAPSIALLSIATPTVVFPSGTTPAPADQSANIWAPELHLLTDPEDGQQHWYLYYTAESPKSSFFTGHKIFVLRSQADSPLGPYGPAGTLLDTKTPSLTIDPTVYQAPDARQYLFFSAYPSSGSTGTEDLYIQALKNPTTTAGDPVLISSPTYDWERRGLVPGGGINEAPEVLVTGSTLNVAYSGGTYFLPEGYSLGVLSVPADADLLDPQTWTNAKQPTPLLTSSPVTGVWSPGHNSFFTSPDGTQTWTAYHAYSAPLQGLPALLSILGLPSPDYRTTRIQPVSFTAEGTPVLGVPAQVTVQGAAPSGDPGLTTQFEGARASKHAALAVSQEGTDFVGGAGVRVMLTPSGSAIFTLPAPDGTYRAYLRQVPDAYGGRYSVSVNDSPAVAVDSGTLSVDLGVVTAIGGSLTVCVTASSLAIADLDEIILIRSGAE